MFPFLRQLIPSMYRRRLWLLALVALLVLAALATQLTRMTVGQNMQWRQRAEDALAGRQVIATVRGGIFDRRGRALAVDVPSWDVAVYYPVINGAWADEAARHVARQAQGPHWFELSPAEQDRLAEQARPPFDAQVQRLWQTLAQVGGLDRAEVEQRKDTIIRRVQEVAGTVRVYQLAQQSGAWSGAGAAEESAQPIGEETAPHAILRDIDPVSRQVIEGLMAQAADSASHPELSVWKRVLVQASTRRDYPCETQTVHLDRSTLPGPLRSALPLDVTVEGVALALVGQLRPVEREDFQNKETPGIRGFNPGLADRTKPGAESAKPRGSGSDPDSNLAGYLPGDSVGRWGIERAREPVLRGSRGQIIYALDSGERRQLDPVPGADVVLTIDVQLQADIQALLDPGVGLTINQAWYQHGHEDDPTRPKEGQKLSASAVVMDVNSGEILAAVGEPGMSLRQMRETPAAVWSDVADRPWINRPFALALEPGSTVKPLVLAAAVTEHRLAEGETVNCTGLLDPQNKSQFRCWIYILSGGGHGPIDGPRAIAESCDVFFYNMGRRLGVPLLTSWYQRFGLAGICWAAAPPANCARRRAAACRTCPSPWMCRRRRSTPPSWASARARCSPRRSRWLAPTRCWPGAGSGSTRLWCAAKAPRARRWTITTWASTRAAWPWPCRAWTTRSTPNTAPATASRPWNTNWFSTSPACMSLGNRARPTRRR